LSTRRCSKRSWYVIIFFFLNFGGQGDDLIAAFVFQQLSHDFAQIDILGFYSFKHFFDFAFFAAFAGHGHGQVIIVALKFGYF
jgi:hypothetical protein